MFSKSIFSNYLGSLLGLAVSKGLRFVAVVLCVRMVGDYSWGQSVSTIAIMAFAAFLVDQGLGSSPLLFHLSNRAADKRLLGLIAGYRTCVAVLLIALIHAFHYAVHPVDPLIRLYSWVLIPRALTLDWWFIRRQLYQVTLLIGSVRTLLFLGAVILWVRPHSGASTLLIAELATEAAAIAFSYLLIRYRRRHGEGEGEAPAIGLRELLVYSFPFLLIGVLNTVQSSMDIVLLRFLRGSEAVASYDIGTKMGFLYFFAGATMIQILRPKLTLLHQAGEDYKRIGTLLRMASSVLLLLTCLFMIPSFFFAPEVMRFVFDNDSPMTAGVFQWVALWVGTSFLTILCADTLLSLGRRRDYVRGAFLCAFCNIAANLVLIRFFSGYGAIFAKVFSEAVFLVWTFRCLSPAVRSEIREALGFQFAVIGSLVSFCLLSMAFGHRPLWLALSGVVVAYAVRRGRVFTRETLAVLRQN
jgi:O-antigen/teichoic acid export membrane protein